MPIKFFSDIGRNVVDISAFHNISVAKARKAGSEQDEVYFWGYLPGARALAPVILKHALGTQVDQVIPVTDGLVTVTRQNTRLSLDIYGHFKSSTSTSKPDVPFMDEKRSSVSNVYQKEPDASLEIEVKESPKRIFLRQDRVFILLDDTLCVFKQQDGKLGLEKTIEKIRLMCPSLDNERFILTSEVNEICSLNMNDLSLTSLTSLPSYNIKSVAAGWDHYLVTIDE